MIWCLMSFVEGLFMRESLRLIVSLFFNYVYVIIMNFWFWVVFKEGLLEDSLFVDDKYIFCYKDKLLIKLVML